MNNMASRSAGFDQIYKQMTSINTQIQNMQQNVTLNKQKIIIIIKIRKIEIKIRKN